MDLKMTSEGFFMELKAKNNKVIDVYPYEKSKRGSSVKGLEITLTGKKEDYHIVGLEKFINHIANGDFNKVGRVRMKPLKGGENSGFSVRKATMSSILIKEINKYRFGMLKQKNVIVHVAKVR